MGDWYSLSPDGFWGNFAPVNPLLNFLRNILISKWLPVAPSPDVLITHLVSPPDSWNWMVISHFIFTVVIRKQFLVCKLHTRNVTKWNMSRLDSWILRLLSRFLKYNGAKIFDRYALYQYINRPCFIFVNVLIHYES